MKTIDLKSRYGNVHHLVPVEELGDNIYSYKPAEDWMPMRYIFNDTYDENTDEFDLVAADPDGGPFLSVGDTVEGKTIKRIYTKKGYGVLIQF